MEQIDTQVNVRALCIGIQMGWYGGSPIPMALEGVPGTGKTEIVQQLGEQFAAHLADKGYSDTWAFQTFAAPSMLAEDIAGIGHIDTEAEALVRWPLVGVRNLKTAEFGVAFFDELTAASQAVGGAMLTAVQSRLYGDTTLPKTVAPVAAWNPPECAAGGRDLSFPEINRFCVRQWSLSIQDFLDYNMGGKGAVAHAVYLPPTWEEDNLMAAAMLVNSYLQIHPNHVNSLQSGDTKENDTGKPWASQRAWQNVTRALAAVASIGLDANGEEASVLIRGLVGDGIGRSFIGHCREMKLPNPEDILKVALTKLDGETEKARMKRCKDAIPEAVYRRPDLLKLCLEGVARVAADNSHKALVERWTVAWDIVFPWMEEKPDMAIEAAQLLAASKPGKAKMPRKEIAAMFKMHDASGATKVFQA